MTGVCSEFLELAQTLEMSESVASLAWSPDGDRLAVISVRGHVFLFDAADLSLCHEIPVPPEDKTRGIGWAGGAVRFSSDGKLLFVAGARGVRILHTDSWQPKLDLLPSVGGLPAGAVIGVEGFAENPDEKDLIVVYRARSPQRDLLVSYRISDGTATWTYQPESTLSVPRLSTGPAFMRTHGSIVVGVSEAKVLATGEPGAHVRLIILDSTSGRVRTSFDDIHADAPTTLAASNDESLVATASATGTISAFRRQGTGEDIVMRNGDPIRVWHFANGELEAALPVKTSVIAVLFSPDGKYLISAQNDRAAGKTLAVWRIEGSELVQAVIPPPTLHTPSDLAFGPDRRHLAVVGGRNLSLYSYSAPRFN